MKKLYLLFTLVLVAQYADAQSLNGNMENWRGYKVGTDSVYNPQGWFSLDSLTFAVGPIAYSGAVFTRQTFQSTDKHSGNYAAKIITRQQDSIGIAPGILLNMQPQVNIAALIANPGNPYAAIFYNGGLPVTQRILSVSAWIKYFPRGGDFGEIIVNAVIPNHAGKDSVIGSFDTTFGAITSYTQLSMSLSYTNATIVPTKLEMEFLSSQLPPDGTPVDSSTMYVDDVSMHAVDVPVVTVSNSGVSCYPNPTTGLVRLQSSKNVQVDWQLFDVTGRKLVSTSFSNYQQIDLSYLPQGLYEYIFADKQGVVIERGKLTLTK